MTPKPRYYARKTTEAYTWVVWDTQRDKVALLSSTRFPAADAEPRMWWSVKTLQDFGIRLASNPSLPLRGALMSL